MYLKLGVFYVRAEYCMPNYMFRFALFSYNILVGKVLASKGMMKNT